MHKCSDAPTFTASTEFSHVHIHPDVLELHAYACPHSTHFISLTIKRIFFTITIQVAFLQFSLSLKYYSNFLRVTALARLVCTAPVECITGSEGIACTLDRLYQGHKHNLHSSDCLTVSCPLRLGSVMQKYVSFQSSYVRAGYYL